MEKQGMQQAKENVMRGEGYLHIKRLPKNTVREIIDFFNNEDEFGGDWALAMKFVWDTFKGTIPPKDEQIIQELELLHGRLNELERQLAQQKPSENPKGRRMASGNMKGK